MTGNAGSNTHTAFSTGLVIENLAGANTDLALLVGKPAARKLLVSYNVLKIMLPVFSALLSPKFAEGQDEDTGEPKEITLMDDEPQALSDMCHLLHAKVVDGLFELRDMLRIFEFAICVDKYGCMNSLRLSCLGISANCADLFKRPATSGMSEHLGHLLGAAYVLDLHRAFETLSMIATHDFNGYLSEVCCGKAGDVIPAWSICTYQHFHNSAYPLTSRAVDLQGWRNDVRDKILFDLHD